MKPRERYIERQVLELYRSIDPDLLKLPLDIVAVLNSIPNCRLITYQEFCSLHGVTMEFLFKNFNSKHGIIRFENPPSNNFIIFFNNSNKIVVGRKRFTIAHELGHYILDHQPLLKKLCAADSEIGVHIKSYIETEADWFASMILAPFPVLKAINVNSAAQIKKVCKLSTQASLFKFEQYQHWLRYRQKTAWENDILRLFKPFIDAQVNAPPS